MSSFWWNFHHWLHWKLSKWQLPLQPVIKISSKWRHFRFSVYGYTYMYTKLSGLCQWIANRPSTGTAMVKFSPRIRTELALENHVASLYLVNIALIAACCLAAPRHCLNQRWLLENRALQHKVWWHLNGNTNTFLWENVACKMTAILFKPYWCQNKHCHRLDHFQIQSYTNRLWIFIQMSIWPIS